MMLTLRSLCALPGIAHAFFTRQGGVSEGVYASLNGGLGSRDERACVVENRARMAAALGIARDRFATVYQVHSPDVVVVDADWDQAARPKADALVTRQVSLAIAVSTADCGPVLFADAKAGVIGAAHAGWKGALAGVIESTVAAMEERGARRADITAALGPTISQANYEVGAEFVARFIEADENNARFFQPSSFGGQALFDLPGYIAERCRAAGIGGFEDIRRCTYADEELFYSYRRTTHRHESDYGRHLAAIALNPSAP
jgi:YfiH family protein